MSVSLERVLGTWPNVPKMQRTRGPIQALGDLHRNVPSPGLVTLEKMIPKNLMGSVTLQKALGGATPQARKGVSVMA